jgi:SAM-dependent methyltransferase
VTSRTLAPSMSGASAFSGSVPEFYDRYMGPWLFEPYAADLVARLPERDELEVLEVACGTGIVTRRLREELPASAILVSTDLNEPMVEYARGAVPDPAIVWQQADAQALPFEDRSFDVVVCQFGFMFLPDKAQGFREARRVLRPGGVLLGNVWLSRDENPWADSVHTTVAELFPADPPRFLETPYGYFDPERIHADLAEAGWDGVQLDDVRLESLAESARDVATGIAKGSPLSFELAERGADPETVVAELSQRLAAIGGERPFTAELAATVISATR